MLQKLYSILGINDTNKMFSLKELDENNKKQQAIIDLIIETLTNKYSKIKMCKKLMEVLEINDFSDLTKDISIKFNEIIKNKWLSDNIDTIKKIVRLKQDLFKDK